MNYLFGLRNVQVSPPSRLSEAQRREMYNNWKKMLASFDCAVSNSLQCADITYDDNEMTIVISNLVVEMFSTEANMPLTLFEQLIQDYPGYDADAYPTEEDSLYYLWEGVRVHMRGLTGDKFQQMSFLSTLIRILNHGLINQFFGILVMQILVILHQVK